MYESPCRVNNYLCCTQDDDSSGSSLSIRCSLDWFVFVTFLWSLEFVAVGCYFWVLRKTEPLSYRSLVALIICVSLVGVAIGLFQPSASFTAVVATLWGSLSVD